MVVVLTLGEETVTLVALGVEMVMVVAIFAHTVIEEHCKGAV